MNQHQFNVGDRAEFTPAYELQRQVYQAWRQGTVIATSKSDPWMVAPRMLRVQRDNKDEEGFGATIPIGLLTPIDDF